MTDHHAAAFRRRNRRFRLVTTLALAAIAAMGALTMIVLLTRWDAFGPKAIARIALTWSPAVFYLWALWTLRGMFSAFAEGGLAFQPTIARALARIGWALLLGAAVTLATAPFILAMAHPTRMGGFAGFNLPALTLAVVGLALVAVAAMLRRGIALEAEAKSLKTELGEFV